MLSAQNMPCIQIKHNLYEIKRKDKIKKKDKIKRKDNLNFYFYF